MLSRLQQVVRAIAALVVACFVGSPATGAIWYVDGSAPGGGNGLSWTTPFNNLHSALTLPALAKGDEIRIAGDFPGGTPTTKGTYVPTAQQTFVGDPRSSTFKVTKRVKLVGQYNGYGQANPDARDLARKTVLSGDRLGDDLTGFQNRGDNVYNVVTVALQFEAPLPPPPIEFEGLTITGGENTFDSDQVFSSPDSWGNGGGMSIRGEFRLSNCEVSDNRALYGAGILFLGPTYAGAPTSRIEGSRLSRNVARGTFRVYPDPAKPDDYVNYTVGIGGAVRFGAGINFDNCEFVDNEAEQLAGAIHEVSVVRSSLFVGNSSGGDAGAIYSSQPNAQRTISNCRFISNRANGGAGGAGVLNGSTTWIIECLPIGDQNLFPLVQNCDFINNYGFVNCSALHLIGYQAIHNCTFAFNHGRFQTAAVWHSIGLVQDGFCFWGKQSNNVYWGNTCEIPCEDPLDPNCLTPVGWQVKCDPARIIFSHCNIQFFTESFTNPYWQPGQTPPPGMLALDPQFRDLDGMDNLLGTADDSTRILRTSPCIDRGNNNLVAMDRADVDRDADALESLPLDLFGAQRLQDQHAILPNGVPGAVDMGVHEVAGCRGDFNNDGAITTPDLTILTSHLGQAVPIYANGDMNGDGLVNTTDLPTFLGVFGTTCTN